MAGLGDRPPSTLTVYRTVLGSRIRAQTAYRASFSLDVLGSVGFALVELLEIYAIFHNVDLLGGVDFAASLLIFGIARTGFSLGDVAIGHMDQFASLIREGRVEVLLVRPASVLGQIITLDFHPRRIGAVLTAFVVLGGALAANDIDWTPARVVLALLAPVAAAVVFGALYIAGGALQLWLTDAESAVNTFTAGGGYAADYPTTVLPPGIRQVFTFIIPAAFCGYLPTLVLLDLPGPTGLPQWLGWFAPVVAGLALAASVAVWRRGLRHYTGAGG